MSRDSIAQDVSRRDFVKVVTVFLGTVIAEVVGLLPATYRRSGGDIYLQDPGQYGAVGRTAPPVPDIPSADDEIYAPRPRCSTN